MIYVYVQQHSIAVIYDDSELTQKDKENATLILEEMPQEPEPEYGFFNELRYDEITKTLFYSKEPIPEDVLKESRINELHTKGKITTQERDMLLGL